MPAAVFLWHAVNFVMTKQGYLPSAVLVITHIAEIFYHCHRIEGSDIAKGFLTHPRICSQWSSTIGAAQSL